MPFAKWIMKERRQGLLGSISLVMIPSIGWANPGDHIRPNDAVTIVPSVGLAMEYRTNVYRAETDPTPGANTRISPGLDIVGEGADHSFKVGGQWDLRKFIFVGDIDGESETPVLNRSERLANLDRFNDFAVTTGAELFRRSRVGFILANRVGLRNNSTNDEYANVPYTSQFRNELNGGFKFAPTSALTILPSGMWSFDEYKLSSLPGEPFNSKHAYGPSLDVKWAFFPRTSFVLQGSYVLHDWAENVVDVGGVSSNLGIPDSEHLSATLGAEGQLTNWLLFNLAAGYGTATYGDVPLNAAPGNVAANVRGLDGLLVTAQLRYLLSSDSETYFGFQRGFAESFFTNYVIYNYGFAGTALKLGDVRPSARYGIRFEEYNGAVARNDVFHRLNVDLAYDIDDWASLSAGTQLQLRTSDLVATYSSAYEDWNLYVMAQCTY